MNPPYFHAFLDRAAPTFARFSPRQKDLWHLTAGITIGLGFWYLHWRWTASLNPEAMAFSICVALAETCCFLGTLIFFFDIWDEGDTPHQTVPKSREALGIEGKGNVSVDLFVTTFDEDVFLVQPSVVAALNVKLPENVVAIVHVLDDGRREEMRRMAASLGVQYHTRGDNRGFKAGNLENAFFASEGDFVVICDSDTQLFPDFLMNTLGYFRDPKVAWVQTPHWFYDIDEGVTWKNMLRTRLKRGSEFISGVLSWLSARDGVREDPYKSDPSLFFDVIQRRRNRHGASFCCGAGSIHRREAIFSNAMMEQGKTLSDLSQHSREAARKILPRLDMQPFRYHVSEDIYTSIQLHQKGWKSVFHPNVEARMLSPWSMRAWSVQRLKYAGGTFDILMFANPVFSNGMPWKIKLHYLATFWAYLGALWLPVLLLAPVVSLFTGLAPVEAYSIEFFVHLLPLLAMNELAMMFATKGHNFHIGRVLTLGTLLIQWRALSLALRGEKPKFPPTPKSPMVGESLRYALPNVLLLCLMTIAAIWGCFAVHSGWESHSKSLLIVNLFWLFCNSLAIARTVTPAFWGPKVPSMAV